MRQPLNLVLAGFGGQGLLFAGKLIAYAGLIEGREVSWLPSYGPEMRGGTANCSVCLSDGLIGSPLVLAPDAIIAMNQPSFDKFAAAIKPGGIAVVDSTMVARIPPREGVRFCTVAATQLAEEGGLKGLANVICVGRLFAQTAFCEEASLFAAVDKCVSASKKDLIGLNKEALRIGIASAED
ncbi:MAG: 2-oxoacid:acceptor oxidoreductase family protein [Coriobacteriaceae bacterium]|jgi:2-oxoglutarate ferredoxin oxidoreductase subunit gamma|nr:2-oxoacid:acceptor oxidoreductase family protein [Coriobacteriaceae bacterium]